MEEREIGRMGNQYCCLAVRKDATGYSWTIESWDRCNTEPITEDLYNALIKFEEERKKS
jgi:hypothetical protein